MKKSITIIVLILAAVLCFSACVSPQTADLKAYDAGAQDAQRNEGEEAAAQTAASEAASIEPTPEATVEETQEATVEPAPAETADVKAQPVPAQEGGLKLTHQGAYTAIFTITWQEEQYDAAGNVTGVQDRSWRNNGKRYIAPTCVVVHFPANATNINIKCEEETGLIWAQLKSCLEKTGLPNGYYEATVMGTTINPKGTLADTTADVVNGATENLIPAKDSQTSPTPEPGAVNEVGSVIRVQHSGAFTLRMYVTWQEQKTDENGSVTGTAKKAWVNNGTEYKAVTGEIAVELPENATNISIKCEGKMGIVWKPWNTILNKTNLENKDYDIKIWGTTLLQKSSMEAK